MHRRLEHKIAHRQYTSQGLISSILLPLPYVKCVMTLEGKASDVHRQSKSDKYGDLSFKQKLIHSQSD